MIGGGENCPRLEGLREKVWQSSHHNTLGLPLNDVLIAVAQNFWQKTGVRLAINGTENMEKIDHRTGTIIMQSAKITTANAHCLNQEKEGGL